MTGIKIIYLILRYGVALAQVMYFQGKSLVESAGLRIHMTLIALSGLVTELTHDVRIYSSTLRVVI
jgi:hypothetical protein